MTGAAIPPLGPAGPLIGAEVAFYVVFGAFVVAFVVLSVITIKWALQRDRSGRAQWVRRQQEREQAARATGVPPAVPNGRHPPATNGRHPPDRTGRRRRASG